MSQHCGSLFSFECEYLIAVLRRDIETERNKAAGRPDFATYHLRNVRWSIRLVEALGYRDDAFEKHDNLIVGTSPQEKQH